MRCTCSLDLSICVFTFIMVFEFGGWPLQPPTFSSNNSKITKKARFQTSVLTLWTGANILAAFSNIHYGIITKFGTFTEKFLSPKIFLMPTSGVYILSKNINSSLMIVKNQ